jgi:hypothetical protein
LLHPIVDDLPCPVIQYANDTLILVRATRSEVDTFSAATGLTINYHKSTFVPICVPANDVASLAAILGCSISTIPRHT